MAGTWLWCGHIHVVWVYTDISCVRSSLGIVEITFTFTQMIRMLGRCRFTALISHNIFNYARGPNTTNMLLSFRDPSESYTFITMYNFLNSRYSQSAHLPWSYGGYTVIPPYHRNMYLVIYMLMLVYSLRENKNLSLLNN